MNKMTTGVAASAVTMLIAVSMIQSATAAERTKKHHAAATTEQVRNANASVAPFYGYPAESGSFRDEALAPPAGR